MGKFPGEGKGYPLRYSCLENSKDCIAHGVTKSRTQLSDFHFTSLCVYTHTHTHTHQFSSVQLLSCVQLFATPWTAARQGSLSFTISRTLLRLMFIVMLSNHLSLCRPLPLWLSIFPTISVFCNESDTHLTST